MSPLIPDEDENFGGSLVLDFRSDENDLFQLIICLLIRIYDTSATDQSTITLIQNSSSVMKPK